MSDRVKEGEARGRLTAEETARLTDQVAGLAKAGLPLGPGLLALAEELPHGRFRTSLVELAESLDRGESLDAAMDEQKDRIPPHLRGLVLGGIRSGRLGDILGRFSGYMSIGTELARKLWLSLAYPILSISWPWRFFLFVHVVLVAHVRDDLPGLRHPPAQDDGRHAHALACLRGRSGRRFVILVGAVAGALALRPGSSCRPPVRRSLATKIPIVGGVWRYISWAEFCHLLALLLESRTAPARGAPADRRGRPERGSRPGLPGHGRRRRARQDPRRGDGGPAAVPLRPGPAAALGPGPERRSPRSSTWPARCSRPAPGARPPSPAP